ncbi:MULTISPECIES: ABC transporter ATP-binding protein [Corynebacterium]|uniref:Trehalose import ATP-binding protein SugC n=1 Tax=Corynebacterium amycolatum TaxID=43765 RepID=A0AAW9SX40_CORAY|nr:MULTISPECIES: sn-glycerol-3-phosphate ABC transporter ATP-binding protein UgpC [Corynebacterium]MBC6762479.1 sn-glycerol-3-phosphate ABC transporter ATP-binding protein UgpC [Corynebacterium sp. LK27]MDK7110205.1 sn-glycerol-3-phosphate ABC transporter ATP-binding protein UgpC [Corynebacterium amycolatum]MDK7145680.1 sn-glycerol-3-phosphate ABC transporter ATP-binding protein UgpC [Corynebacterium amycolatum]MDK7238224.1 sn-glycerol-3-phosphate ABC transporter ATP-binding protein UgpC [Coryn
MAEIELKHVYKRFPDGHIGVEDANLKIDDGEFIILVGPSGCGKSTMLNMIAGLEDISEGDLLIDGERMNDVAPKDRDIAMVFQSYALYPHMNVRENIAFPLNLAKLPKKEIEKKVNEAAEILDLTEFLDRKPAHLSGGQRQRVAMGRAIVRRPKVFLMDEPLSNLDAKLRVQMRTEIAQLQERLSTTTVYVTHDQTEAMTLGDRVVVLKKGVIQQIGAPQELYHRPVNVFVAGFIGSPAMNFLPATVLDDGHSADTALGHLPLPEKFAPGRKVIVGLRPEAFEDAALTDDNCDAPTVEVEVSVLEAMGSEQFIHFPLPEIDLKGHAAAEEAGLADNPHAMLVARVDAESNVRRGQKITLAINTDKLNVFDSESGENLALKAKNQD